MSYASAFERDIFISYCHTDNENPLGLGWIEVFHKILLIRLRQILGTRGAQEEPSIWRDAHLQGNETFAEVLEGELARVAVVVSVMSPSYVRSPWCLREVGTFCSAAEESGGITVDNKARIFKVLKTPVPRDQHPAPLQSQIGYEFYTLDKETKIPKEYTLTPGDGNQAKALEVINDLAYHIKATLDAVNHAAATPANDPAGSAGRSIGSKPPAAPAARRSVYLAETSFELDEERSLVRRDLEARGLRVLPEGDLPVRNPKQFRQAVADALATCELSIHMIAAERSLVLAGEVNDTVFVQNQLAAEQSAHSKLARLIWIPEAESARVIDAQQQQLIASLHSDPAAQRNAEVLTNTVQGLIARTHDALRKLDDAKAAAPLPATGRRTAVYLIAHPDDVAMAEPLREHLFSSGFDVLDPLSDPAASETDIFETHKMNLVDCDAVVICYGRAGEFWMRTQRSDVQKAIGWRDGQPLKARAIYLGPPESPPKTRLLAHDYLLLDASHGFAVPTLQPLLSALGAPA